MKGLVEQGLSPKGTDPEILTETDPVGACLQDSKGANHVQKILRFL